MGKKAGIITTISIIGVAGAATGIGIAINASNKKNDSTPTQPTPIGPTNITFTNNSITELKNSLISIIDNEKLTRDKFNSNLLENIKRNFNIDNKNVGNLISRVEFNNQNILDITFNETNTKYSLDTNFNNVLAILNDNVLSIPLNITSNFYTAIEVDDSLLINLRNEINNYLSSNNMVTKNDINSYLMNEMYSFFENAKISNDKNLLDYVYSPTYSNNSILLKLKTNIGKYKFVQSNNNDISIINNEIILNNIESPAITIPQESPEDWFTWGNNGTQITGLSATGQNQKRIVLPSKATSISNNAFYNNKTLVSVDMSLTKINSIPDGVGSSQGLFRNASNIVSISLPSSLTSIGSYAFYLCNSLTSINIPDGVTSIGSYAFYLCNSLTSINIPDGVTSIGSYAFYLCNSLTSINIPDGVTSIGSYAFYLCNSLTSINIHDGVTIIKDSIFRGCNSLTSINIPDGVTSIGNSVFNGCSSLTSISIPDSVNSIGNSSFYGCSSLTSINIHDGLTSIEPSAFYNCKSIVSITIPDSVTSIGDSAFALIPSTCVMNVSSTWDQTLATNAGYTGTFNINN